MTGVQAFLTFNNWWSGNKNNRNQLKTISGSPVYDTNKLQSGKPLTYHNVDHYRPGGPKNMKASNVSAVIGAVGEVINYVNSNDHLRPVVEKVVSNISKGSSGGSSGGGRSSGGGGRPTTYGLSNAPDPLIVDLSTGIKPQAYTNDFMEAIENKCSPLHMTGAMFKFPDYAGARLRDYFIRIISSDMQTKAQANVSFNLNISDRFTSENILSAMNTLTLAIQYYLYNQSIITYASDPRNKNEGMLYLRERVTPEILEAQYLLGRLLADLPIPPNLLELLRYLSANFFSGINQGSAIIKIYPQVFSTESPDSIVIGSELLTNVTNALSTNINKELFSLMRRAIPQWIPGWLKDVPTTCVYDQDFLTIFANLPFVVTDAIDGFNQHPRVVTESEEIPYNSFTNELDGTAFALTSCYLTTDTNNYPRPGLMQPVPASGTATGNTRLSFYEVGGNARFYVSKDYPFLTRSRMDTYQISDAKDAIITPHLYGCDRVLGVSVNSLRVTSQETIDYLMSLSSIVKTTSNSIRRPRKRG
jgi:hypothetical protein